MKKFSIYVALTALIIVCNVSCAEQPLFLNSLPEYSPSKDVDNQEWYKEESVDILGYKGHAMEAGISPDGKYLLFNDWNEPNKDMHWSERVEDRIFRYRGKVKNTVSNMVDGTPSFDAKGNVYYTTLKTFPESLKSIYKAKFFNGSAIDPEPITGNIYVEGRNSLSGAWVSIDPDITDDGSLLVYSEGHFSSGAVIPYPFNVRIAEFSNGKYVKLDDRILKNINTQSLEYAPAISKDGLEIFFTRISKIRGKLKFIGIFTAKRRSLKEPFGTPEKIKAITGTVEAPVLSGDEKYIYYHKMDSGKFRIYRVKRKRAKKESDASF